MSHPRDLLSSAIDAPRRRFEREHGGTDEPLQRGRGDAPIAHLQEQVEGLREVRERLGTDLEVLGRRLDALERLPGPSERDAEDAERVNEIRAKFALATAVLRDAQAVRAAVTSDLANRALERPAPDADRPAPGRMRIDAPPMTHAPARTGASRPRRLVWALAAALALSLVALTVALLDGDDAPTQAQGARAGEPAAVPAEASGGDGASAPEIVPCERLPAGAGADGSVTCTTGTLLTIAAGDEPLLMSDTEARVLAADQQAATVALRLRVRNGTSEEQVLDSADRRIYLSLAGRRIYSSTTESRVVLPPGEAETVARRYMLDPAAASALRAAGGRVDVGIVPLSEPAGRTPRRIGVIKVTVG